MNRLGYRGDVRLQGGVDAVGTNHDVRGDAGTRGENHGGVLVVLFEADAAVAEPHNVAREIGQQYVEHVGSVHTEVIDG
jgi:hypothetical protein